LKQVQVTKHEFLAFLSSNGGKATREEIRSFFNITDMLLRKTLQYYRNQSLVRTNVFKQGDVVLTNFGYKMLEYFDANGCKMPMCICHKTDKKEGQEP